MALHTKVAHGDKRLLVAITSIMGPIVEIDSSGSHAYHTSKAALNAIMRGLHLSKQTRKAAVLILH